MPGIALISPPPHHDIYSIEDLAQLIHDLKTVNPRARVGVKLVAESGVGTVAAGVAKAYADYVLIAGHNGDRRVAALLHQARRLALGARAGGSAGHPGAKRPAAPDRGADRRRIQDRTRRGHRGLLGAESYGFGTAPLVALGCAMARQCHSNTCPTGVATQRADLRAKFKGTPEQVIAYFTHVAEEVRRLLAAMGARSLDEIIGRNDLLERVERPEVPRAQMLDLSLLLAPTPTPVTGGLPDRRRRMDRNDRPGVESLDQEILEELQPYLDSGLPFSGSYPIHNHHLAVGARLAGRSSSGSGMPVSRTAPCASGSPAPRARASAPSPAGACISSWRARPTTTWARD